jgi:hypothetical protein
MIGAMSDRPQKITFADMRDMGVRGLLVYCSDYKCMRVMERIDPFVGAAA